MLDSPTGFALSTAPGFVLGPSVASDGARYLVAWAYAGPRSSSFDIYATRIAQDGRVLDPRGIPVSTAADDQEQPAVAANGPFLVAWRDDKEDRATDVAVTTISGSGTVARPGGQIVTHSPQHDQHPAVARAASRGRFRLAWQHFTPEPPYGNVRVYTRTVAPT
jgi:hypothetical protein